MASGDRFLRLAPHVMPRLDRAMSRLTRGRLVPSNLMVPTLILTHTGAKSGLERHTPLATLVVGKVFYITGSNYGGERHPAWSGNLLKTPSASVTFHGRVVPVTAHALTDDERAAIWPQLVAFWPVYDRYVEKSGRELRVFRLDPQE